MLTKWKSHGCTVDFSRAESIFSKLDSSFWQIGPDDESSA
jgi:hypothetical protein